MLVAAITGGVAAQEVVAPYEKDASCVAANEIDTHVLAALKKKGIKPANVCSDEVFLRRAYLDATGTLPTPWNVQEFMKDTRPDKRARVIDALLEREEFAEYQAMKWCDVLRVKSEFPINLWPNAAEAYHRWIYDAFRKNMPYDKFARELLTASGSNFRDPQANFYRAAGSRDPQGLAAAVALTFMGTRIDKWPDAKRADMVAFFSRVRYKATAEWKEEIVYCDSTGPDTAFHLPDGKKVTVKSGDDPRKAFADWLTAKDKRWFGKNCVNRIWASLMGRGIISEVDDIRDDNPPSNPALLAYLEKELVASHYDLRHVFRLILNSRTYQQSSIPRDSREEAEAMFAYYPVRRLEAEVLIDALCQITGVYEEYSSQTPEPYTFIPDRQPAVALADGSITSEFLEMFGRPPRDTGFVAERNNDFTDAQRLHLLNSTHIRKKIESDSVLQMIPLLARGDRRETIRLLYLNILSRYPTPSELQTAESYYGGGLSLTQASNDLAWALVNTKEFLYRH